MVVNYKQHDRGLGRSHIFGNALEALIGAVYLDQGFARTRSFILKQVIKPYIDIELLESTDTNYKNKLLSWAQRNAKEIVFDTVDERNEGSRKIFTIAIVMDGQQVSTGSGYNKKEAGQVAAQKAIEVLAI
jgi:ribonuclease-3